LLFVRFDVVLLVEFFHTSGSVDDFLLAGVEGMADVADINLQVALGRIIVDMGNVTYIDSSTIGVLLAELKRLRAKGGNLRLIKLSGAPRNVLEMARLDGLFPQFDDEKKAIASFEEGQ